MAAGTRARRRASHGVDHEDGERWLLTYSDMITLLLALFILLFSISSVNISKYQTLQQSLRAAFSGAILSGGRSILQSGSDQSTKNSASNVEVPSIVPLTPTVAKPSEGTGSEISSAQQSALVKEAQNASQEQTEFRALQRRLNAYAKAHGFSNQVQTQIQQRGLVVTVLTDKLLFVSGQDSLRPAGEPLLNEIATLIDLDTAKHPVNVEGYTDDVPIHTALFPSNWELSTGRADSVLEYLLTRAVASDRLSASGYADHFPVASNATTAGRARNRRVEIVFERKYPSPSPGS
jgi:chemotaxis protein MotB